MNLDLILLSLALAADACIVGFSYGLVSLDEHHEHRVREGLLLACLFGFFQFIMSYAGSFAGHYLTFLYLGPFSHWMIVVIFAFLGLKMIIDSFKREERQLSLQWHFLVGIAFATSVDALAVGISFGTLPQAHYDCIVIGLVTFLSCLFAYGMANFFRKLPEAWALRLAATLMFFMAFKTYI